MPRPFMQMHDVTSACPDPPRLRSSTALALAVLLFAPVPAIAHTGEPPEPHDLWTSWGLEPGVLLGIGVAALIYRRGLRSLWGRAGPGRGIGPTQAFAYAAGLLVLLIALVSPLDPLATSLFSAHMAQHLLLAVVAGPLIALGAPVLVMLWSMPRPARHAAARVWRRRHSLRAAIRTWVRPASAWLLHAAVIWVWHVPALYDLALRDDRIHILEHVSFLLTAVLFWWIVLPRGGALRHLPALGILYLFTFALQGGFLGAALALSTRPWFTAHSNTTQPWGLTPLEDQQLAGAVMWVPGGLAYLVVASALLVNLFRRDEQSAA